MSNFVHVAEDEGEDPIELPAEEDGSLLLSTVAAQFPGASGLRYKATPESKTFRGVRLIDGVLFPPPDKGWDEVVFLCVFPKENKRKSDDTVENSAAKTKRLESKLQCTDLIVLGLPWKTTEEDLREYFESFGDILVAQIKKDKAGQSKGYGFIRFSQYESQMRVLAQRHMIDGRWCDVKVPSSKEGVIQQLPRRIFVGRCTEDMSIQDLKDYFTKFGEVTDVFMPKPFRAFCFVTFLDPDIAQKLCGEDHIIKGVSVHVSNAAPKSDFRKPFNRDRSDVGSVWADDNPGDRFGGSGPSSNSAWNNSRGGNVDLNSLGSLMNPAFVAAALNQAAGWSLMSGGNLNAGNFGPPGSTSGSMGSRESSYKGQNNQKSQNGSRHGYSSGDAAWTRPQSRDRDRYQQYD